jgi:hypothetical protein
MCGSGIVAKLRGMHGKKMDAPQSRAYRRAPQRLSHGLEQAQRLVGQGLKAAGLDRQDLKALPGSDARKVALNPFPAELFEDLIRG